MRTLQLSRQARRRARFDRATRTVVRSGGAGVIAAITLIFVYLLWVVAPIFIPGSIDAARLIPLTDGGTRLVDMSENGDALLRVTHRGRLEFYSPDTGAQLAIFDLGSAIDRAQRVPPASDTYLLRDGEGNYWLTQSRFRVTFRDDRRELTPDLHFPFGVSPLPVSATARPRAQDLFYANERLVLARIEADGALRLSHFDNAFAGEPLPLPREYRIPLDRGFKQVFLGPRAQWAFLISADGHADVIDLRTPESPARLFRGSLIPAGTQLSAAQPLLGRYSLLAADDAGGIRQWVMTPNELGLGLELVREFQLDEPAARLIPEPRRKGFASLSASGRLTLLYPTSRRQVAAHDSALAPTDAMAIAPRSDYLLAADASRLTVHRLHNEHPEISGSALWSKIWYEGYEEPVYSWQSSSASNDFEPKFSLAPLAFGTLKAAFYALLFAVPLAVMGALYTAYFMAPRMRALVKPGIEIMAALPTVILGFIGGLWLAPLIETNLSSVLAVFVVLPALLTGFAVLWWWLLPETLTRRFEGWYALVAIPLIVLAVWGAFSVGPLLEERLFGGNSRIWLRDALGLDFDQRNALVVGLIMGLAVIPAIFSIAEDAVYSVPRHLVNGSLALGATPWQTLTRVVLLTASPGIFSAVMIGMGRAVGETMIVLMATGNTPLMNFNVFEGMRTFAANIAVELPESEVGSSHYRILFLAALVLFLITFAFNTVAELVRQRLRERYGNL